MRIIEKVEVWLTISNTPVTFENVKSIYEQGSYTCFHTGSKVHKYNTSKVWRIVHPYGRKEEVMGQTTPN